MITVGTARIDRKLGVQRGKTVKLQTGSAEVEKRRSRESGMLDTEQRHQYYRPQCFLRATRPKHNAHCYDKRGEKIDVKRLHSVAGWLMTFLPNENITEHYL